MTTFEIKNIVSGQGIAKIVTIVLRSASSPDSELDVAVFCKDLSQIDPAIRAKLLEFAEELQSAARS